MDLEVEGGGLVVALAGQHEFAQAAHRWALAQGVIGQHALEDAVVRHLLEQLPTQLFTALFIAPDHAQVEVDARTQQVLRAGFAHETGKAARPLGT